MRLKIFAAGACLALALAGCASPLAVTGPTAPTAGLSSADQLAALQEVNRHIETCDRTYAWPFAVTIHCAPVAPTAPASLTAADVEAMLAKAMASLAASLSPPAK